MNIERYKASKPMQTVFITNADGCGDQIFTQLERSGQHAIYRRNYVETGKVFGYEVITIKTVKAGTVFAKGAKPTENDYESYPGKSGFGRIAWFFGNEKDAWKRFDELILGKYNPSV